MLYFENIFFSDFVMCKSTTKLKFRLHSNYVPQTSPEILSEIKFHPEQMSGLT